MTTSYAQGGGGTSKRLAVVILAGGDGRRIGGGKPSRRLAGQTLLDHALALARNWADVVAVAVREPVSIDGDVAQLQDDPTVEGPLAGVASALRFAAQRGFGEVLTIPCDSPFLPADLPARLGAALAPDILAAVPESGGRLHPACTLWRVALLDRLDPYLRCGRRSLMGLIEQAPFARVAWPAAPLDPFFNINSPDDLAEADRRLRSRVFQ